MNSETFSFHFLGIVAFLHVVTSFFFGLESVEDENMKRQDADNAAFIEHRAAAHASCVNCVDDTAAGDGEQRVPCNCQQCARRCRLAVQSLYAATIARWG